jgi:hypothetical protein
MDEQAHDLGVTLPACARERAEPEGVDLSRLQARDLHARLHLSDELGGEPVGQSEAIRIIVRRALMAKGK